VSKMKWGMMVTSHGFLGHVGQGRCQRAPSD
jgi:hypothetical protein